MENFIHRVIGASKLKVSTYEDVEADKSSLGQAITVVMLSSLAASLSLSGLTESPRIALVLANFMIAWLLWAWLTFFIGTRILPEPQTEANWGQLLRTTGFAASPGILRFLGILPGLTIPIYLLTEIWMLVAFIIAVRQALDYTTTGRAVGVCLIGWSIAMTFNLILRGLIS